MDEMLKDSLTQIHRTLLLQVLLWIVLEFLCMLQVLLWIVLEILANKRKLYGPFLWMGFNCLKVTVPLQGDCLLFTTKSPEVPGTHLIDCGRIKS